MKSYIFIKSNSILIFWILILLGQKVHAQDYEMDFLKADKFYRELIQDKKLSLEFTQKGVLLNDFYIDANGKKVLSVYRKDGVIFSSGTPILFLDKQNLKTDSLYIKGWPQNGINQIIPTVSPYKDGILFFSNLIYPDSKRFSNLKKASNGIVLIDNKNTFYYQNLKESKWLWGNLMHYNDKKEEITILPVKQTLIFKDVRIRRKNNLLGVVNNKTKQFWVLDIERNSLIFKGTLMIDSEIEELVNIELVDDQQIVFVTHSTYKFSNIYLQNFVNNEVSKIFKSLYYIPRAKVVGNDIYFEIAGRFEDSAVLESIILKYKNSIPLS